MNALPRWIIHRPYLILAVLTAVVILGVDSRFQLPVQLFPDTDPPMVNVITPYSGMAAEDVAENLSKLMEEEFAGIDGVRSIRSTSQEGLSVVEVEFDYGYSSALGAVDVQNAISRIRGDLPQDMQEPQVQEFSSAQRPIITLAMSSQKMELPLVRELAENRVRDRLNLVSGVAAVDVLGANRLQMQVYLDRDRLKAHGITQEKVANVLRDWNLTDAGGRIRRGILEDVVRFDSPLTDPDEIENLVLQRRQDSILRLGQVAQARLKADERPGSAYHFQGRQAIAVQILKRDEANTVDVADRILQAVQELEKELPQVDFAVAEDDSDFTRVVINSMTLTILSAIMLTVLVVLFFLRNLRQAMIVTITIPTTFLATFSLMRLAGLQLDMVTMSAIILSIGLLVDDSIVILENIQRYLDKGLSAMDAAVGGTGEILQAKLGGTLTTLAVLVPLIFLGGFIGEMFRPLAITLSFALAASLVTAMILVPFLAFLWITGAAKISGQRPEKKTIFMDNVRQFYLLLLNRGLNRPGITLFLAALLLMGSLAFLRVTGSEMMPRFDSGSFRVLLDMSPGTDLTITRDKTSLVEKGLVREPAVTSVSTRIGYEPGARYLGGRGAMDTYQAEISVEMKPRNKRDVSQWEVMDRVREQMRSIPSITLGVAQEQGGTARATTAAPVVVRISGDDPAVLDKLADQTIKELKNISGLRDIYKNWAMDRPEIRVDLDKDRAAELGLSGQETARTVRRALDGEVITPFRQSGLRDLDIVLRYSKTQRRHFEDLEEITLLGKAEAGVSLADLASFEPGVGPRLISREDFQNTLEIRGWTGGERPLSHVVQDTGLALQAVDPPAGYQVQIAGEQTDLQEARSRMLRALAGGALAVYLLLMIQFRSLVYPLVVMAAVPLQFTGVAAALAVGGKFISMPALLGIILLTGIVVNNSIILVDFILNRLRENIPVREAITSAVDARCRPVLMTAFSTVAGMLPLALELAVGSERFSPLAMAIIGGVLASTLFTLVVIPVLMKLAIRHAGIS